MFNSEDKEFMLKHKATGEVFPAVSVGRNGSVGAIGDFIKHHAGSRCHVTMDYSNARETHVFHIGNGKECHCAAGTYSPVVFEETPHGKTIVFYDKDREFNAYDFGSKNPTNFFVLNPSNKASKEFSKLK